MKRQGHNAVDTHLGHAVGHVLDAVDVFGRCHSNHYLVPPVGRHVLGGHNLEAAPLGVSHDYAAAIQVAAAVDDLYLVALDEPQHPHAVLRLFLGKRLRALDIGMIETMHDLVCAMPAGRCACT